MNAFKKIALIAVILSGLWIDASVSSAQTKIILREKAIVPGPGVLLGEIAEIEGGTPEFIEKLGSINLSLAPPPTQAIAISNQFIEFKLKENRIEKTETVITGVTKVLVYLDTVIINGVKISEIVREYLLNYLTANDTEHTIEFLRLPAPRPVAKRDLSIEVRPLTIGRMKGSFNIQVGIYNGDKLSQSIPVPVRVRTFEKMVVASHPLPIGTVITVEDIKIITAESTMFNNNIIKDMFLALGKETKRQVKADQPLWIENLATPKLIKRGDPITIEVTKGGITILCKGIAKQDGRLGDTIQVSRINERAILYGVVNSSNKVLVK